jgi:TRAP-type uncharacterized transport system substrate-binding protein
MKSMGGDEEIQNLEFRTVFVRRIFLTIFLTGSIFIAACEKSPSELRLVRPAAPTDQAILTDLAALMDRESAVQLVLTQNPESGLSALDSLAAGTADVALVSNTLPFREGVSTVIPLYPTVLHIAYFGDRDASNGRSLIKGARVYAGAVGSGSHLTFERFVSRLKLSAADFTYIDDPTDAPDVVIVFAPISPKIIESLPDIHLFSMGSPREIGLGSFVDAAALLNPQLSPFVIPAGTYGDVTPEPVVTVAVDKLLVVRADLPKSVVYDLVNELQRLRPAIAALRPGLMPHASDDFDASRSTFVLHQGAQAYLQRSEPSVYERYSGVAEVTVTVLIGLVSAGWAGVKIFRMRRKNRIDRFYSKVIEIRKANSEITSDEERAKAIAEVRALQDTAFELLVDERLAADESFRIFITLSDDVMKQLEASANVGAA